MAMLDVFQHGYGLSLKIVTESVSQNAHTTFSKMPRQSITRNDNTVYQNVQSLKNFVWLISENGYI